MTTKRDYEWKQGDRVRFFGISETAARYGGADDPREVLVAGHTYVVQRVDNGQDRTGVRVLLEGFEGRSFNSVAFTYVPRDSEVAHTVDEVLSDPSTSPEIKRAIQHVRDMGFEPEVARQSDLDLDQRTHWDRLHDAAGLPRRTDLALPPPEIELPPLMILQVLARVIHQCQVSYHIGQGSKYEEELSQEHMDNLVDLVVRFIKNPKMTPIEVFPGASTPASVKIDTVTLKATRVALTLAGINL